VNLIKCEIIGLGFLIGRITYTNPTCPHKSPQLCNQCSCRSSISLGALIIVPATSDQMRNTVFLVGSAHPMKTSIPAWTQACGNGLSQRDAGTKRDPAGRNHDQCLAWDMGIGTSFLRGPQTRRKRRND